MKLTTEQLQVISGILDKAGVDYIDYRYEILDHLASDVEAKMEQDGIEFKPALRATFDKWGPLLEKSVSTLFGVTSSLPRIILGNCKRMYLRILLHLGLSTAIVSALLLLWIYIAEPAFLPQLMFTGLFLALFLNTAGFVSIKFSGFKSSFGFVYKQQYLPALLSSFILINSNYDYRHAFEYTFDGLGYLMLCFWVYLILVPVFYFRIYRSHFRSFTYDKNKLA